MRERSYAAPVTAVCLLLLPYFIPYAFLVQPNAALVETWSEDLVTDKTTVERSFVHHYRIHDERLSLIFGPIERLDRVVRPQAWKPVFSEVSP